MLRPGRREGWPLVAGTRAGSAKSAPRERRQPVDLRRRRPDGAGQMAEEAPPAASSSGAAAGRRPPGCRRPLAGEDAASAPRGEYEA